MYKSSIVLLLFMMVRAQEQDTLVKYFPTDIQRSEILDSEVSEKDVKGKSHFKSTYSGQGKLLNVEYIPGRKKGREKLAGLKLYYSYWDIEKRTLADGLTNDQLDGRDYYEVAFNNKGRIKNVKFIDKNKRELWSYVLIWNKAGTKSRYKVEFHIREPLTLYDEFLFVDDLSEMRKGWVAEIKEREDNRPLTVTIKDKLDQVYYFYTFKYLDGDKNNRAKEIIVSEYFREDSTKVGMHKLFYNKNEFLQKAEYYIHEDSLWRTHKYDYSNAPREIMLTTTDQSDRLIEKRLLAFSSKYKRKLGPPKDKTGLADVMLFLEDTSEEDLNQLVHSIEGKFDVTVEMDTIIHKNILEVEPEEEKLADIQPDTAEPVVKDKKFNALLNLNRDIIAGSYIDSGKVNAIDLGIMLPYTFKLFWFNIQGGFGLEYISYNTGEHAWGRWVFIESADFISFPYFPIVFKGGIGKAGAGLGLRSGIYAGREIGPVKLELGTNAILLNNIDGNKTFTGYLNWGLAIMYPFDFPKINIPIPWFK
ncbi:MAG: hypothetical protein QGI44_08205 [Candidatus Marinimicrobia bacterium]|jgi:hypothetical protein|nr:hypothetical protein [Candidatus Neomarinimicrobiota bacterium]MDP7331257.1 hypothetical protein [Candidatus Neomarinimicrobiota bacterium]MDP7436918.1 hypothetical protein [Candidatus Neomarinimicrobiota bacterium]HJL74275.1 hypothetical protein [Candidatus Neomarinimicrobiota bacterium]|tara:strand:+ start:1267 stop:2859 length:1593 start_codon:yes stop_codon:yes gene_type:complete